MLNAYQAAAGGLGMAQASGQGQANAINAPRELGYIERVQGLSIGLETLSDQMQAFICRIQGMPVDGAKSVPQSSGLPSVLSDAESNLRRCFEMMKALSDSF